MLDDAARRLAQEKNFATLTTLLEDGRPATHVMWIDADDAHILINTETGRQKFANVKRDPRVSVVVIDAANPYRYAEVRGRVVSTITGAEAREHIDRLSEKYTGHPYSAPIRSERVILQIEPERVRVRG